MCYFAPIVFCQVDVAGYIESGTRSWADIKDEAVSSAYQFNLAYYFRYSSTTSRTVSKVGLAVVVPNYPQCRVARTALNSNLENPSIFSCTLRVLPIE